ncbi:uncharacterized protein TRAVEDRAFT_48070 [Trametes versicolor FP-101664 SS1]|uniref:uncharacterized protein n=1 Tax=Trametes versicolor (strain FP-101664) TaxID=717944 RepID=UPI000462172B|nr:uncharacterized protein TRAVEDRAFT_48070 [Trametes versicolor FP-101664 SS1]EIW58927.1 hypothetical protein TRAVEDRAFT_48070 [Trametes versicolor FP-101664 SS1]
MEFLEARLEREPDLYLSKMRKALRIARDVDVCEKTIANLLNWRVWTYKQIAQMALERSEVRRAQYL